MFGEVAKNPKAHAVKAGSRVRDMMKLKLHTSEDPDEKWKVENEADLMRCSDRFWLFPNVRLWGRLRNLKSPNFWEEKLLGRK